ALAALVAMLLQPQMLFDLSFQLSYLALLGLLTFTAPLCAVMLERAGVRSRAIRGGAWSRRARVGKFVVTGIAASVGAQLPSLSLVAGTFGSVPLLSPLVNLVAVPVSALLVPLGFAAGLLGLVAEPLAWLVNRLTYLVAGLLTQLARWGDGLPALAWAEVGWLGHLCWALAVTAVALYLRRRLRARQCLAVMLLAGACSAAAGGAQRPPDVWFLDVGQGDATLIRLPGRFEVLVDGGGSPFSDDDVGERVVLPVLRALGVDELEVVVATHPDADHVEGLFTVLERVPVGTLVTAPALPGNALDDRLRGIAAARGIEIRIATRAETLVIGRAGATTLEVLHPRASGGGGTPNEESVVLLLRYADAPAVLLLADVGVVTERELALGRVAVLKVGHHGSRYSTSEELLVATAPRLAVISVGENNYGHPHPTVLDRLAEAGVKTLSTAASGAIRLDLSRSLPPE
ncbi:MAG TPA: ComEC/Rec2 family competence protein, partial [Trueperaceae bacterium]|nr:ComEC/Rec2 family competence protein [Trueperaceae bacterium]